MEWHTKRFRRERDLERERQQHRRFRGRSPPRRRSRSPRGRSVRVSFEAGADADAAMGSPLLSPEVTPKNCSQTGMAAAGGSGSSVKRKKRRSAGTKSREEENELLLTIMASVLQSSPPDQSDVSTIDGDDGKLHYYQGLHDIAALFLINLESPSLTSLVLSRLAHTHLRDAMRSNFTALHAAIRLTFMPLLQGLDPEVHDYIVVSEMDNSCVFALSWILSWFGHDVLDVHVASRLADFFIASHALMPM